MGGKQDRGLTLLVNMLDKAPDAPLVHFDLPLIGFAGNKNRK